MKRKMGKVMGESAGEVMGEQNAEENASKKDEETVEALLFIAGKFLSVEEISALTGFGTGKVRAALETLEGRYNEGAIKGAIKITSRDGFYKMDVKPDYSFLINKLASGESEFTKAEQETLAVIAYKRPVKQSLIIKIRGNKAYEHIKKLATLGLLNSKKEGRTFILDLSENFYSYFSISEGSLKELKPLKSDTELGILGIEDGE